MVLQRDRPIPVWGTAAAGEAVSVELDGQKGATKADKNGNWRLELAPMVASSGLTLRVQGHNTLTISDVAVGEVWLASGQSNMAMPVSSAQNADAEIAAAQFPLIRQFRVERRVAASPQSEIGGQWQSASPATVGGFSAVAYFFARELHQKLGVPIGIINSSYGGTIAQAWTDAETLQSNPKLSSVTQNWAKTLAAYPQAKAKYDRDLETWKQDAARAKTEGKKAPKQPTEPRGPGNPSQPSGLYNGMIAPLVPYAVRGVIWYQGESNRNSSALYYDLFPAMIRGWRGAWNAELPFYWVQLPNYYAAQKEPVEESGWVDVRDAQSQTLALPQTGMAVATDVGEAKNIHPKNKQAIGHRLVLVALAKQYGMPIEFSGPQLTGFERTGGALRLDFSHADGLKAREGALQGFAIAGADGVWHWAQTRVENQSVVVSSPDVAQAVAARYNWANNPTGNLVNATDLPAAPFRTDTRTEKPAI